MKLSILLLLLVLATAAKSQTYEGLEILQRSKRNSDECSRAYFDFYFLVDVTSSVPTRDLRYIKTYLNDVMRRLNIGSKKARISLTSFGTKIKNIRNLNQAQSRRRAINGVNSLRIERGRKYRPIAAMNYMADNLFTAEHGFQSANNTVCILVLATLFIGDPSGASEKLQKHCNVVVVGLARATFRQNKVSNIASGSGQTVTSRRIRSLPTRTSVTLSIICHKRLQAPSFKVARVTDTYGTIRWKKPSYAVKNYKASIRRFGASRTLRSYSRIRASQSEITFRNLQMATSYLVYMSAVGRNNIESRKRTLIMTTGLPIPTPQLRRSTITTSSVVLFWNSLPNSRYYVTVTLLGDQENITRGYVSHEPEYTLTGLKSGSRYQVTISTLSLQLRSDESTPIQFTTTSDPPVLRVSRVRPTEVVIRWRYVPGATYYNVTVNALESDEVQVFNFLRINTLRISNLAISAAYRIIATTMGENGFSSTVSLPLTVITAPGNPENVRSTTVTSNLISFEWESVTAARSYRVKVTSRDDKRFRVNARTEGTDFTLSKLKPGFDYKIVVLSVGRNDVVDENVVDPLNIQTVPSVPRRVRITDVTATSVTVEWGPVRGAGGYIVFSRMEGNPINVSMTPNTTQSSATVGGLRSGAAYTFQVVTEGIRGRRSASSRTVQDSTHAAVPSVPTTIAINSTFISIQLHPAEGATSYTVRTTRRSSRANGRSSVRRRTISDISSPLVLSRLRPGNWYNITVTTASAYGKKNPLSSPPLIEQTVPSPPLVGEFRDVQSTSLIYSWPEVQGAKLYALYVTGDDASDNEVTEEHLTPNNTYNVTNLLPGTQYQLKLQSLSYQDRRSRVSATATRRTIPGLTKNIRTTQVTTNSIRLAWDTTRGSSRYRVVMVTRENNPSTFNVTKPYIEISDLSHGAWYNFTIYSRSSQGLENPTGSEVIRVQTVPLPTTNVQISDQSAHSYLVTWDLSEGALGYNIHAMTTDRSVRNPKKIVRVNGSTSALVDNLASGVLYRFFVVVIGFQEQSSVKSETVSGTTLPMPPSDVFLDEVLTSRITASWGQIKGAVQFAVSITRYINQNVTSWEILTEKNFIQIDNLTTEAWYNLSIYSIGVENRRNPESSPMVRAQTVPASPIALEFYNITTTSISMGWNSVAGADSYIVSVRTTSRNQVIKRIPTSATNVVVDGLEPGTSYLFQLITIEQDDGRRSTSSAVREETMPSTPETPTLYEITDNSVQIEWNKVKGARKYIVEVKNSQSEMVQSVEAYTNNAIVYDLDSGTQYFYSVSVVGARNRRNPRSSDSANAYTAPSSPKEIRTDEIETDSFRLMWNEVQGALSYAIILRTIVNLRSSPVERMIGPLEDTQILVDQLSPGTEYHIFIQATGKEDRVSELQPAYRDATLPSSPSEPTASRVRTTSVRLTWPLAPGALKYLIYVRQEDDEEEEFESFTSHYLISDLLPGTRYSFSVQSVGALDRLSASRSAAIQQQTLTEPPTGFVVTSTSTTTISLQWNLATGASSYSLTITTEENDVSEMTLSDNTAHLRNLDPGSLYNLELRSIGDHQVQSLDASEIEETTLPLSPSDVIVDNVTSSSIQLSWVDVKGAESYMVVVNTTTTFNVSSADINLDELRPGEYYAVQIYSVDLKNRSSENASPITVIQTAPSNPNFVIDAVTNTSIYISWPDVVGAAFYRFDVRAVNTEIAEDVIEIETNNSSFVARNLLPGISYTITGCSLGRQSNRKGNQFSMIVYTLPNPPEALQVISVTTTSVKFGWAEPRGAESYLVELEEYGDLMATTNSTFEKTDLQAGTYYNFVVYSVGNSSQQNLNASPILAVQTAPDVPENMEIIEETSSSVTVTWDDVIGRSGFEITVNQVEPMKEQENSTFLRFYNPEVFVTDETLYTIDDLTPGTIYNVRFKTYGLQNQSSVEERNLTVITPPTVPQSLQEIDITTTSITVEWNVSQGATQYEVELQSANSGERIQNVTSDSSVTVTGLTPGDTYHVVVYAIGINEKRSLEGSNVIIVQTVTLPPSQLSFDDVLVTSFSMQWNEVLGAKSYNVYIREKNSEEDDFTFVTSVNETTTTVTSLDPGTEYVILIYSEGEKDVVSTNGARFETATLSAIVENIVVVNATMNSIAIEWDHMIGATRYVVETRRTDQTSTNKLTASGTVEPTYTASNLVPGASYGFIVYTVGVSGIRNEEGSSELIVQTVTLPPTELKISNVTVTSFRVEWTEVFGAHSYNVYVYRPSEGAMRPVTWSAESSTSRVMTSLEPGSKFMVRVSAVGGGSLESAESNQVVTATKPEAVEFISAFNIRSYAADLEWKKALGALKYIVNIVDLEDRVTTDIETNSTSANLENLLPGTRYQINIVTVGPLSTINENNSVTTDIQTVPLPPSQIEINNVTTTSFKISWSSSYGADAYRIFLLSPDEDAPDDITTNQTSAVVTSLVPGTQYFVSLISMIGEAVTSQLTPTFEETTLPGTTPRVSFLDVKKRSVTLSWNEVKGAESYEVLYRQQDSNSLPGEATSNRGEATISGLEPGKWFEFVVYSVGIEGRRNEQGSDVLRLQTIPLPPKSVTVGDTLTTSVIVRWMGSEGAAFYRVSYSSDENADSNTIETASTRQEVAGLRSGTTYTFHVRSVGEEGQLSGLSQEVSQTTLPATPTDLRLTNISTTSAKVMWEQQIGAVSYKVSIFNKADNTTTYMTTNSTPLHIPNLFPGVQYKFIVFSIGMKNKINNRGSAAITTRTVPRRPSGTSLDEGEDNSIQVSWKPVIGADSYFVAVTSDDDGVVIPPAITTSQTSTLFHSLTSGTLYYFSVTAISAEGRRSAPSRPISHTILPGKPRQVGISSVSTTSFVVQWNAVKGAPRYRVLITNMETGEVQESESDVNDIDITSLLPGSRYNVVVFSFSADERLNLEGSDPVVKQTLTSRPTKPRLSDLTSTSALLSWQEVFGAQSYLVTAQSNDTDAVIPAAITTTNVLTNVSNLSSGTIYSFTAVAVNYEGESGVPSRSLTQTTLPDNPSSVRITAVRSTAFAMEWNPAKGAVSYRVALLNDETDEERTFNVNASGAEIDELDAGTWYYAVVLSVGTTHENHEGSRGVRFQTVPLIPSSVEATVNETDLTSVLVSWLPSKGASNYRVTVSSPDTSNVFVPTPVTTSKATVKIENLTHGTRYGFAVVAIGEQDSESEFSRTETVIIAPATVNIPTIADVTQTGFTVQWLPVKGAVSYFVFISNEDDDNIREEQTNQTRILVSLLEPGSNYEVHVLSMGAEQLNPNPSPIARKQTIPQSPSNVLIASDSTTTTSISLSWQPVKGASAYEVIFISSNLDEMSLTSNTPTAEVAGLLPGTEYRFQIIAVGEEGQRSGESSEVIAATKPEAVSEIRILSTTNTTVTLQWNTVSGAQSYRIESENLDDNAITSVRTSDLQVVISNLRPGTQFRFKVVSIGPLQKENTDENARQSVQTVPNPPRAMDVTTVRSDSMDLVWSSARGASLYQTVMSWNETSGSHMRNFTTGQSHLSVDGLVPGTRYHFTTTSITEAGIASAPSRGITETTRPAIATNLFVSDVTTNTTTLRWDSVKGAHYYEVLYGIRNSPEAKTSTQAKTTQTTIGDLQTGTWYEFVVFSVGHRGRKSEQSSSEVHVQTNPATPSCPLVSNVTTTSLRLTWSEVVGADSYSIRMVQTENGEERNLRSDDVMTSVNGLEPGTEYEFYVTAIGEEDQRSAESDVMVDWTLPNTPQRLTLAQVTTTTAGLLWSSEKGALQYRVSLRDSNERVQTAYSTENDIKIYELLPGEQYVAMVMAMGANNRTNPAASEPLTFQTVPLPPSQIRSSFVTTTQVRIVWDSVHGAQSYKVRVSNEEEGAGVDVIMRTSATNVTIDHLVPGTRYSFYVTAIGYGTIESEESAVYHESTIPSTPTNLQTSRKTTSSAMVTWDFVKGATFFTLTVTSNNANQDFTVISTSNNFLLENLISGGWYDVKVASTGANNRSNPTQSESIRFQTVPQPPSNARVTRVLTNSITLEWDGVLGASSYVISYIRDGGRRRDIQTTSLSYTIRGLAIGTPYNITLATVAQENDLTSTDRTHLSELTTINSPTEMEFRDETATTVALTWDAVDGAIGYFVDQSSSNGAERYEASETQLTVTELEPGTNYSFSVGTIDTKQRESATTSRPLEVTTVTLPVRNIQVEELRSNSFTINWGEPKGADEYEVVLYRNDAILSNTLTQKSSFTFRGIAAGTLYRVAIAAININDKRSEQAIIQQRTVPLPPSGLRVSAIKPNSLSFIWNDVVGGQFYDVYITMIDSPSSTRTSRFDATTGSFTGLLSGTKYKVTVFSVTEEGIISTRNVSITQATMPSAPRNVVGRPLNHTAIQLRWNDVRGATEYAIYYSGTPTSRRVQLRSGENNIEEVTVTDYVIGGLQPLVNYSFWVVAIDREELRSDRSKAIALETYAPPPVLPITNDPIVVTSNIRKRSFLAAWDAIPNSAAYLIIVRSMVTIDEITVRGQNTTRIVVSSLSPNTNYNITIKAIGVTGTATNESYPPAQITTHPLAPMRPFGIRVTKVRATYFEIAWEPMPRAITYDVSVLDETIQARYSILDIQGTTANVTNLRVLNYYNVTVSSVGMYEISPPSNPIRVQTRHPIPVIPRSPDLIDIDEVTYNSMRITVAPVEYAISYVIIVRQNEIVRRRISDVQATVPVPIGNLQQNTVYDVTYQAVGRGRERSVESEVIRTRTQELKPKKERLGRLIPSLPVNFQVIRVTSGQITLRWSPARHALTYRVSVQNSRTGGTRLFNNVTSPFNINGLEFRETYNVSVSSVGRFYSSAYVQPITVEIPYPGAEVVRGLQLSQVTASSFLLQWLPAPFATSYTVILDEVGGGRREIRNILKIEWRLQNLKQSTQYNATVQAVSHNGAIVPATKWVSAQTGKDISTATLAPEDETLSSVVQEIVNTLKNIPDSVLAESPIVLEEESQERIQYRNKLREMMVQLRQAINTNLARQPIRPGVLPTLRSEGVRRFDVASRGRIDRLFDFSRELKIFVRSNDSSRATADSIANRLTRALTELLVSNPTESAPLVQSQNQKDIRNLLFAIVSHELDDLLTAGSHTVEEGVRSSTGVRILTVFVKKPTITSTGFTLVWGRYENIHRYEIVVEEMQPDGSKRLIERGVSLRQSMTLNNLTSSTVYSLTVRPVDSLGSIIPGVVGRINVTTANEAGSGFQVNATSISFNRITLSWSRLPAGVRRLTFRISRQGNERVLQQITVNRAHRNVLFTSLLPGASYRIIATSGSTVYFDKNIARRSFRPRPTMLPSNRPPGSGLLSPTGLRVITQTSSSFTIQWMPVAIKSSRLRRFISYNVRLYEPNSSKLRRYLNYQRTNRVTFSQPLHLQEYDVTVSTYNFLTRKESPPSEKLRVVLQNARR